MDVLLDTCCVIWAASEPDALSADATRLLGAPDTDVSVSAISCAEVACLAERDRIELDRHWKAWFRRVMEVNAWRVIDIDLKVLEEAYSLPGDFHRDPADRIITATARLSGSTVLTADHRILDYPHVEARW
ncbi:MAG: type II toxin-antitoxin system VapC family toxin [Candidatus Latescibacteria bacterium]|nr:type II toxin-antitoxin system VapC family toxin [Candidatus Latescibacterota bacterium]MDP7447003.1 type II toxin-antitoxin system VapC family toxin [Candidatus Latescibacterota bacterium]HJP29637.1 type II toxin-antitoxin system VapC family toxin [Candidatus Latescibacterota bacterium]